jgi:EAL domain-containing protein (putative c-di-GMP-specific phosphodiesterase class I)
MSALADDLRRALLGNEFFLVYQPKVSLTSGRWTGVEALLRWRHPELGLVPPGQFIPFAEAEGLMQPLTARVIAMALERCAVWQRAGFDIAIAINLSARDIEPGFPDGFESACSAATVAPRRIAFELTETATHNLIDLLDVATRLRLKGTRLSIDDFGTGYSSVVQLHRLPFSEVKIDRIFVSELESSTEARTIVRAIVDLAHALGLGVIAEGPETAREVEFLTEIGCDQAQGYFFARPTEADAIPALWRTRNPATASARG